MLAHASAPTKRSSASLFCTAITCRSSRLIADLRSSPIISTFPPKTGRAIARKVRKTRLRDSPTRKRGVAFAADRPTRCAQPPASAGGYDLAKLRCGSIQLTHHGDALAGIGGTPPDRENRAHRRSHARPLRLRERRAAEQRRPRARAALP